MSEAIADLNGWKIVRFDRILKRVERKFMLDDSATYDCAGVRWYGMGSFIRENQLGMNISRKQQWILKTGDVVYNKLFAWKGSFAIADSSVDGCIVSDKFPTYEIDTNLVDSKFLGHYFRTPQLAQQAQDLSKGAAAISKLTLNPPQFWDLTIPLPPIVEQQRIVARVEELAGKVEEARGLRLTALEGAAIAARTVPSHLINSIESGFPTCSIGHLVNFRNDLIRPIDGKSGALRFIGLQHIESHTGKRIGEDRLLAEELTGRKFKFSPGEVVYGYLRPYLNKVWVADCDGVCSVDQYVIQPNSELVDTNYLVHFMRSQTFLNQAIELTHNLMLPRLRTALLESIMIPLPPLPEQSRIVAYMDDLQAKFDGLKRLQAETQAELNALLPSILDKAFKGEF